MFRNFIETFIQGTFSQEDITNIINGKISPQDLLIAEKLSYVGPDGKRHKPIDVHIGQINDRPRIFDGTNSHILWRTPEGRVGWIETPLKEMKK